MQHTEGRLPRIRLALLVPHFFLYYICKWLNKGPTSQMLTPPLLGPFHLEVVSLPGTSQYLRLATLYLLLGGFPSPEAEDWPGVLFTPMSYSLWCSKHPAQAPSQTSAE